MQAHGSVLITGGAGFIGSHLSERMIAEGWRVVVLDNFDEFYDPAVKRENLREILGHPRFRLVEADIREPGAVEALIAAERIDAVVHLAARAGVRPSIADPLLYASVNLVGTTAVLEACRRQGVGRLVFGSSSSVYGNNRKVPFAEDDPVDNPISPYAATKKAGELICHTYHHLTEIRVACLRFFTVYGPRQRPEMAIQRFARLMAEGRPIQQFGDGTTERDYTFVDDIVDGILRALERAETFHIWNLGGSRTVTLKSLIAKIAERLGVEPNVECLPAQPGDVDRTWADIGLAARDLDWAPTVDIDRGLDRFTAWFRRQSLVRRSG